MQAGHICQIMRGDGAELRCSSAYVLGHGVPSLSRREGQQSLQARVVGSPCAGTWLLAGGHVRRTPFEGVVTVFGSTELIRGQFCCAANIAFLRNILYSSFIRCTANNP